MTDDAGGDEFAKRMWATAGKKKVVGKPFQKGQSGNPGGRAKIIKPLQDLAREHTEKAVRALVAVMGNAEQPGAARVAAASAILDRGYGKAAQTVAVTINPLIAALEGLDDAERSSLEAHIAGLAASIGDEGAAIGTGSDSVH